MAPTGVNKTRSLHTNNERIFQFENIFVERRPFSNAALQENESNFKLDRSNRHIPTNSVVMEKVHMHC